MWPFNLSVRLPIVDLVGRYLTNYLIGRELIFKRISPLITSPCENVVLCGISSRFQLLSPTRRQIAHVLLTRSPLSKRPKSLAPFDLHVLGAPPAFVLSQDQTLYKWYLITYKVLKSVAPNAIACVLHYFLEFFKVFLPEKGFR